MHGRAPAGFTLVETLIALVIASFLVVLVSHAFLVQNEFYSLQTLRIGVQDNTRAATELVAREVRNVPSDGVVVAGRRTLTIRSPIVVATVCNRQGPSLVDVMSGGGEASVAADEVAGLALRNDSTWEYGFRNWSALNGNDNQSANNCEASGADTVGARDDFHRLVGMNALFAGSVFEGDVVMIFRETTFTIGTSQLDSTTLGLFRADYGDTPVEFATGIDTTAHFEYRTAVGTYADTVLAADLSGVDAIRFLATSRKPPPTGGRDDVTFGWSVDVPLRNVREDGS